jgi:3-oxochol-4-en-24-oyl-CoA dehydrogenase
VLGGGLADVFVVRAGNDMVVVDRVDGGVDVAVHPGVDPTRRVAHVTITNARVEPERVLRGAYPIAQQLAWVLVSAEAAGAAHDCVDTATAYAKDRLQFGRPIAMFQAVKHHCANMAVAARRACDQANFAAVAVDDQREDAAFQVDCALLVAGTAALENSGKNIQVHGGIGFSDEADPHLLLKRAQLSIALAGGLEAANSRIADSKATA